MIKRPLNARFSEHVKSGRKFTTIRDNPWETDRPIMLYNWSGAAYRSKQIDVASVEVLGVRPITITRTADGMRYSVSTVEGMILWGAEGFESGADMDAWFESKMKVGQSVTKCLMRFRLLERGEG